jgi:hypothetical protein
MVHKHVNTSYDCTLHYKQLMYEDDELYDRKISLAGDL